MAAARVKLLQLFERVESVTPVEFAEGVAGLVDIELAWRECVRYDMSAVESVSEKELKRDGGRTLGEVMRQNIGAISEGYLSVFGVLPWVRGRIADPLTNWMDDLWKAGADDILVWDNVERRLFAVISDGHDEIVHCIVTTEDELIQRITARATNPTAPQ